MWLVGGDGCAEFTKFQERQRVDQRLIPEQITSSA